MSKEEKAIATRADWKTTDMPEKNSTFILSREFSAEQIAALRHGNIPKEMEDRHRERRKRLPCSGQFSLLEKENGESGTEPSMPSGQSAFTHAGGNG